MVSDSKVAALLLELQERIDNVSREQALSIGFAGRVKYTAIYEALYDHRKELVMNIHCFWLKALVNHPAFSLLITEFDSRILCNLVDVDIGAVKKVRHAEHFELVFTFAKNDYFDDLSLTKRYTYSDLHGRHVGVHDIKWKGDMGGEIVDTKGWGGVSMSGFFRWIAQDRCDTSDLGELIRREVYPRAIELYFGTYSMASTHQEDVDAFHY